MWMTSLPPSVLQRWAQLRRSATPVPPPRSIVTGSGNGKESINQSVHRHRSAVEVCTIRWQGAALIENATHEQRRRVWYGPSDDRHHLHRGRPNGRLAFAIETGNDMTMGEKDTGIASKMENESGTGIGWISTAATANKRALGRPWPTGWVLTLATALANGYNGGRTRVFPESAIDRSKSAITE